MIAISIVVLVPSFLVTSYVPPAPTTGFHTPRHDGACDRPNICADATIGSSRHAAAIVARLIVRFIGAPLASFETDCGGGSSRHSVPHSLLPSDGGSKILPLRVGHLLQIETRPQPRAGNLQAEADFLLIGGNRRLTFGVFLGKAEEHADHLTRGPLERDIGDVDFLFFFLQLDNRR